MIEYIIDDLKNFLEIIPAKDNSFGLFNGYF